MSFRVLARRPQEVLAAPGVEVIAGDVTDENAVRSLITPDCQAVISALGIVEPKIPTTVFSQGMTQVVHRMQQTGIDRLIAISASGFHIDRFDNVLTRMVKPILKRIFKNSYADLACMETVIAHSGLVWTIVVPPQLTDGPLTMNVRRALGHNVPFGFNISRSDVAHVMLRCISDATTHGELLFIAR